jgi:hypothetical protein
VLRGVNAMASNNGVSYSLRRSGQSTLPANCKTPRPFFSLRAVRQYPRRIRCIPIA